MMSEPLSISERSLYLVTGNAHKVEELRRLLPDLPLLSLREHPLPAEPVEDGETFIENSLIKSLAGLKHARALRLNLLSLADDSGLEVDALQGAPGVRSARYAPGTDVDRYQALLRALRERGVMSLEERAARFRCALSLTGLTQEDEALLARRSPLTELLEEGARLTRHTHTLPSGEVIVSLCALGTFEGTIALEPSGAEGFGYDPIFIPKGHQKPVACLSAAEKDALSHRGAALALLAPVLRQLW